MLFEKLKESLKNKIENIYIICGSDEYLKDKAYSLILNATNISFSELNIAEFKEGDINFDNVLNALILMPAFSNYKIVYVDLCNLSSKIDGLSALENYSKNINLSSVLILKVNDLTLTKKIENSTFIDCNVLSEKFVLNFIAKTLFSNKKLIDENACKLLLEFTASDLSRISMEIPKLVAFIGEREKVEVPDIVEIVNPTFDYQIFELTEALGKLDKLKVFKIMDNLNIKKQNLKSFLPLIYSHFRRLFHIALNENMSKLELANYLNVKEYAITKSMQQVKYFSKKRLLEINNWCADFDYKTKNSIIDSDLAINLLILKILN